MVPRYIVNRTGFSPQTFPDFGHDSRATTPHAHTHSSEPGPRGRGAAVRLTAHHGRAGAAGAPSAQEVAEVRAKYVKREVRIPMRDGAQLFTSIYVPRDTSRPYPIMMSRTPYGVAPYGDTAYKASLGPSKRFQDEGFTSSTRTRVAATCPTARTRS